MNKMYTLTAGNSRLGALAAWWRGSRADGARARPHGTHRPSDPQVVRFAAKPETWRSGRLKSHALSDARILIESLILDYLENIPCANQHKR